MDTFKGIGNGVASLGKGSMNLVGDVAKGTAKLGKGSIHMVGNVAKGTVNAVEYVGKGTVNIAGSGFEAVGLKKSKKEKSEEEISPEDSEEESEIPESDDESEEKTEDESSDSVESEVPAPSKKTKSPTKTFGFFGKKKEAAYRFVANFPTRLPTCFTFFFTVSLFARFFSIFSFFPFFQFQHHFFPSRIRRRPPRRSQP